VAAKDLNLYTVMFLPTSRPNTSLEVGTCTAASTDRVQLTRR
jgi:hypothetical protein